MTFTIMGVCRRTGKTGFAQATSTPAVGWRCTDVVHRRGVVTVQATGDYRQLQIAKRLMAFGFSPVKVLSDLQASDPYIEYRQIAIIDGRGNTAAFTGSKTYAWAGQVIGDHHIATGNVLVGSSVVEAMSAAFEANHESEIEERLLRALEAGRDAGGQPDGQRSSALVVYGEEEFPLINLRVDLAAEPVSELRKIFDWFRPLVPYYVTRTNDPSSVGRLPALLEEMKLPQNPYL